MEEIPLRWPLDVFTEWRRTTGTAEQVWPGASRLASLAENPGLRIPRISGFELTLIPPIKVDWSVAIESIEALDPLVTRLGADPTWERVSDVMRRGSDDLARQVILEFDTHAEGQLIPSVFLGVRPPVADPLLAGLAPMIWRPALREQVARVLDAAAGAVTICYFGFMFSRPSSRRMRLCVGLASPADVAPLLREIGWKGRHDVLASAMRDVVIPSDVVSLALDVGDDIAANAGIEIRLLKDRGRPWDRERWSAALDALTGLGLCTPEMARAIVQWRGGREYPLLFADPVTAIWEPIHIKLSVDSDGKLSAKAYLLFRVR